jgi:F-type H+-transporting ATPase subunit c
MENVSIIATDWLAVVTIAKYLGAVLVMAAGAVGASVAQAKIAAQSCESIAQNPNAEKSIKFIFGAGIIAVETSAIYCLLIAIILLLK